MMNRIRSLASIGVAALAVLLPDPVRAQGGFALQPTTRDARPELDVYGRVEEISLSPDGRVWMGSMMGELFVADSIDGDWWPVINPGRESLDTAMFQPHFDRASFFDVSTGIVSGYIGKQPLAERHDVVLRTTDGGRNWRPVPTGEDQWVYHVFLNDRGEAWMGGSAGTLLYTSDAGATWQRRGQPFGSSARLNRIFMEDSRSGIVGALSNEIRQTRDGGATWTSIPTPLDQGRYSAPDRDRGGDSRIQEIAYFRGHILAAQDGRVFATPRERIDWREVSGGLRTFVVDPREGRAFAVDTALHVVEIGVSLEPRRILEQPLNSPPTHLVASGGRVYVLDQEGGLYRIGNGRLVYTFPLSAGPFVPAMRFVRSHGGRLWGATGHHLYHSDDGGRKWTRLGATPFTMAGVAVLDSSRVMVWDAHGANGVFDRVGGGLSEVAQLRHDDVVAVVQAEGLWAAYGGRQHETAQRVEVAQTFFGGQFRGSRENGFVYVSRDRGGTWQRVDEWENGGVASAFVHPGGALTLFSYLGSVRRLAPEGAGYRGEDLVVASGANAREVPYVQTVGALYFSDEQNGFVDGWIHHVGDRRFVTSDGGRTWRQQRPRPNHFLQLVPVRGGWAGHTGNRVVFVSPAGERLLFDAGTSQANGGRGQVDQEYRVPRITDLSADEHGNAVILLRDGAVYVADPEGGPARRLGVTEN